jgi:hypothetical protein
VHQQQDIKEEGGREAVVVFPGRAQVARGWGLSAAAHAGGRTHPEEVGQRGFPFLF